MSGLKERKHVECGSSSSFLPVLESDGLELSLSLNCGVAIEQVSLKKKKMMMMPSSEEQSLNMEVAGHQQVSKKKIKKPSDDQEQRDISIAEKRHHRYSSSPRHSLKETNPILATTLELTLGPSNTLNSSEPNPPMVDVSTLPPQSVGCSSSPNPNSSRIPAIIPLSSDSIITYSEPDPLMDNESSSSSEPEPLRNHDQQPSNDADEPTTTCGNFLFLKVLSRSDVGDYNRLVIPKRFAELHFPCLKREDGSYIKERLTLVDDRLMSEVGFEYWKKSKSYVFTRGWKHIVNHYRLRAKDEIHFYTTTGLQSRHRNYMMYFRRITLFGVEIQVRLEGNGEDNGNTRNRIRPRDYSRRIANK